MGPNFPKPNQEFARHLRYHSLYKKWESQLDLYDMISRKIANSWKSIENSAEFRLYFRFKPSAKEKTIYNTISTQIQKSQFGIPKSHKSSKQIIKLENHKSRLNNYAEHKNSYT